MNTQKSSIIHDFSPPDEGVKPVVFFAVVAVVLCIGLLAGYGLAQKFPRTSASSSSTPVSVKDGKSEGIADKKTFKDSAEGTLREGGLDGEGNFNLERKGGVSQTVYLTSSTVDLSQYIGKKIKVQGETFSGQKAAWLMDVGLVEVMQ